MSDRLNTIFGWVLVRSASSRSAFPSSAICISTAARKSKSIGYAIQGAVEGGGEEDGPDLGTLLAAADPAAGEKVFAKCTACHSINSGGANGIGPNLYAIMGAPIGQARSRLCLFSSALTGSWAAPGTYAKTWMLGWRIHAAFAPGTKMSFAGLGKPEDRANVIAYMKENGGGPAYPEPAAPEAEEIGIDGAGEGPGVTEGTAPSADRSGRRNGRRAACAFARRVQRGSQR